MKYLVLFLFLFSISFAVELDCYKLEFQDTIHTNKIEAYFYTAEIEKQHIVIIAAVKIGTNKQIDVPFADDVTNWCNHAWTEEFAEWAGCTTTEDNTVQKSRLFEILIYAHQIAFATIFRKPMDIPNWFPDAKPRITK